MKTAYTADQIRQAEQALMARLPDGTLMQRAAAGLAAVCADLLGRVYGSRVVLLTGSGDNGGDALYAGQRLARRGARVGVVAAGSKTHEAGLRALLDAGGRVVDRSAIDEADLIIDGLVGIGVSGALREPYAELAQQAAAARGQVVAVDVPSGVDASTGRVEGAAVRARVTVTMGGRTRRGCWSIRAPRTPGGSSWWTSGSGPTCPTPTWPRSPTPTSTCCCRGRATSRTNTAEACWASRRAVTCSPARPCSPSAVRCGAAPAWSGTPAAPPPVAQVRSHWPESVVTELDEPSITRVGRVQAWVLGPGLGTDDWAHELAAEVLASDVPVLVDADALTLVARDRSLLWRNAPVLITPHAGELARLLRADRDAIEAARLEHARRAAAELGVTVLLKGSTTVVAEDARPVRVNPTGTSWLATGGTGDVLAGLAGALLAQGLSCYDAASCGAYLHGVAGRLAAEGAPLAAGDVATALPRAIRAVTSAIS
ncbi:NAD(P)H-hydrate dehydratase [Nonomuraea salmonea]|uniref:NAD(P)H-hydrate dehydratase n=1 Tax=Nonomuraea salmonea TaxID=46181 RepID=UPI002FEADBF2